MESQINKLILEKILENSVSFFAQFRGEGIILFELTKEMDLRKIKLIQMNHCGFSKIIFDRNENRLFLPSKNVSFFFTNFF